jgi:hypothetical protein
VIILAYADVQYYYNEYAGSDCEESEVANLLEKSGRIIDMLTGYRITSIGFDNLGESRKELVKRAVCAEADFLERNGGDLSEPAEVTLGSFRYVNSDGGTSGEKYSPEALGLLEAAGLSGRRVTVL